MNARRIALLALLVLTLQPVATLVCEFSCLRPAAPAAAMVTATSCHKHMARDEASPAAAFIVSGAHCGAQATAMLPVKPRSVRIEVAAALPGTVTSIAATASRLLLRRIDASPPPLISHVSTVLRI